MLFCVNASFECYLLYVCIVSRSIHYSQRLFSTINYHLLLNICLIVYQYSISHIHLLNIDTKQYSLFNLFINVQPHISIHCNQMMIQNNIYCLICLIMNAYVRLNIDKQVNNKYCFVSTFNCNAQYHLSFW